MNISIRHLLILLLVVPAVWISCSDDDPTGIDQAFEAEESFYFSVEVDGHTHLDLEGITGAIVITGSSATDSIRISGVKRVESSSLEDAQQHLPDIEVNVQDLGTEVSVVTTQPGFPPDYREYEVDYTITLPATLAIQVGAVAGTIEINSIDNDVTVDHVSGSVDLSEIFGSTSVGLVSGEIDGTVTLPTGGAITMSMVTGTIDLSIPVSTSAEFSASLITGEITVSNLTIHDRVETSRTLSGTLGAGDGSISLATTTGNIYVSGF